MKRDIIIKALVPLVALFSLLLLVPLASAIPPASLSSGATFIPATCYATGPPTEIPGTSETTPSGVEQKRGWTFSIPNALVIGDTTYDTLSFSTFNGWINTITSNEKFSFDTVWTVVGSPSDGYRGHLEIKYYNVNLPNQDVVVHVTAQGFGAFAGQTLKLSFEGPDAVFAVWTGYCVVQK